MTRAKKAHGRVLIKSDSIENLRSDRESWCTRNEALWQLKRDGYIFNYELTRANECLDKAGIDVIVQFIFPFERKNGIGKKDNYGAFCFQVKSSKVGLALHKARYPGVPAVVLPPEASVRELKSIFLQLLGAFHAYNSNNEEVCTIFKKNKGKKEDYF